MSTLGKWYHVAEMMFIRYQYTTQFRFMEGCQLLPSFKHWCKFLYLELQLRKVGGQPQNLFLSSFLEVIWSLVWPVVYNAPFFSLLIHVRLKHHFHLLCIQAAFCWFYLTAWCLQDFSLCDLACFFVCFFCF